jgi:hypothetical protein
LEFAIQFACRLVIFVCVACILDSPRVPSGILEAGKIAPQANPVNSGVHTGGKNADQFASAVTNRERPGMAQISWSNQFSCSSSNTRVSFF